MNEQKYSVNQHLIETILTWVKSGEIAIPEIQRPFVWDSSKVRDLMDSLYQGYPVGYIIAWRNPNVRLKDGTFSEGKRVLIDGQQRVTALTAAVLGKQVVNKDYKTIKIQIAFHPVEEKFEVLNPALKEKYVQKWFVLSILTGRYSGSPESVFDYDIKNTDSRDFGDYLQDVEAARLSEAFWSAELIQKLNTSVASSPVFNVFLAAQCKLNDRGFLSKSITVKDLIEQRGDVHHLFPREYLKKQGMQRGQYNQIANYVYTQSEINIKIGKKAPNSYFSEIKEQCNGGELKYGGITDMQDILRNMKENCIPTSIFDMTFEDYQDFIMERRLLIANKIKNYYETI